jgi:hypothetical protein
LVAQIKPFAIEAENLKIDLQLCGSTDHPTTHSVEDFALDGKIRSDFFARFDCNHSRGIKVKCAGVIIAGISFVRSLGIRANPQVSKGP